MNIKITGRSIEVTDAMKDYIEKRLERLEKFEGKNISGSRAVLLR